MMRRLSSKLCRSVSRRAPLLHRRAMPVLASQSGGRGLSTTSNTKRLQQEDFLQPKDIVPETTDKAEIKDPHIIFNTVWKNLEERHGAENMTLPKDIMWLSGAPGGGKGIHTRFIMEQRGINAPPIVVSDLLTSPEATALKQKGHLVGDRMVVELVFEKLLNAEYRAGAIVDGFPRTPCQGECIILLYDKMREMRRHFEGTQHFSKFRRPIFHITVLFVEEELSVERQIQRGVQVNNRNKIVEETGVGQLTELRPSDLDPELSRLRYRQFKDNIYQSLKKIKSKFLFHFIDASGTVADVRQRIMEELEYQSSAELHEVTFEKVRRVPLASEIVQNARHDLVARLDNYSRVNGPLFNEVIDTLNSEFVGILRRQALTGKAIIRTENSVFDRKHALDMALDVLTERGYSSVLDYQRRSVPDRVSQGEVILAEKKLYEFHITWQPPNIRSHLSIGVDAPLPPTS